MVRAFSFWRGITETHQPASRVTDSMNRTPTRLARLAMLLMNGLATMTHASEHADRAALETAMHRWTTAVNAQDAVTLGATMTGDVELIEANTAVKGREAAIRTLREVAGRGRLVVNGREIMIADGVAWRVVAFTQIQKNGDVHARGQALEVWRRVDGQWQLHRQMSADLISPGVTLTRPSTSEPVLDRPAN